MSFLALAFLALDALAWDQAPYWAADGDVGSGLSIPIYHLVDGTQPLIGVGHKLQYIRGTDRDGVTTDWRD